MDSSRVLLAVILSIILVVAYQELVLKRFFPAPSQQQQQAAEQAKAAKAAQGNAADNGMNAFGTLPNSTAPGAAATAGTAGQQSTAMTPSMALVPERTIEVDSDLYVAVFTTHGARLKSFRLNKYRQSADKNSPPYEMVQVPPGGHLPLGAVLTRGGNVVDDSDLSYETNAPEKITAAGADATAVFIAKEADGTTITKTFTFKPSGYVFTMDVAVSGGPPLNQLGVSMSQPLTAHQGYYDIPALEADVGDKSFTENEKDLKKGVPPRSGPITYAGFGDQYFLAVFLPLDPKVGTLAMAYIGDEAIARLLFDDTTRTRQEIYMGPKLLEALESVNPALTKAITFGWAGILGDHFSAHPEAISLHRAQLRGRYYSGDGGFEGCAAAHLD